MVNHALWNFLFATGGLIAVLWVIYLYIRPNGPTSASLAQTVWPSTQASVNLPRLRIESSLSLEPRKQLMVVGYGKQRFLIASSGEQTELLSTLESMTAEEEVAMAEQLAQANQALPTSMDGLTFKERFLISLRMVLTRYFPQTGGK